jgi:flagellar hook-associated protein 2
MSSPITFSGFNNIDFNSVLNALMTQASQPLVTLQAQQRALLRQVSAFDTLRGHMTTLRSAADDLSTLSSVSTMAGTSSHSAVAVSVSSSAAAAHYDVVVNELARSQVTVSTSSSPDPDTTAVATGGTITIGGVAVSVSGNTTLQGLADAINGTSGIGVTATVVRTSTNAYRLALTSNTSGAANAFTITNALTGGAGVTFADGDNDGTSGDQAADNAVTATDASILLNNVTVTSSTNTFADVVTGVTLTVTKKDPATTVSVDVAASGDALATKIEAFVSAYNETVSFLDAERVSAGNGETSSIGRDPVLRQIRNDLRTELLGIHGTASVTRLAEIGIEFTRDGRLELDRTVFDDAVATNGADVRQLLAGTSGAFPAIETALDAYTNAAGYLVTAKDRVNHQIDTMDSQILTMESRLLLQREMLQRQFTEADAAMSRLKNQSGSLASIGSGF